MHKHPGYSSLRIVTGAKARDQSAAEHAEFWKQHRIVCRNQTYDYVFYIVAAAVIGENPRLLGFSSTTSLAFVDR